jgi:hypothetical protein
MKGRSSGLMDFLVGWGNFYAREDRGHWLSQTDRLRCTETRIFF